MSIPLKWYGEKNQSVPHAHSHLLGIRFALFQKRKNRNCEMRRKKPRNYFFEAAEVGIHNWQESDFSNAAT